MNIDYSVRAEKKKSESLDQNSNVRVENDDDMQSEYVSQYKSVLNDLFKFVTKYDAYDYTEIRQTTEYLSRRFSTNREEKLRKYGGMMFYFSRKLNTLELAAYVLFYVNGKIAEEARKLGNDSFSLSCRMKELIEKECAVLETCKENEDVEKIASYAVRLLKKLNSTLNTSRYKNVFFDKESIFLLEDYVAYLTDTITKRACMFSDIRVCIRILFKTFRRCQFEDENLYLVYNVSTVNHKVEFFIQTIKDLTRIKKGNPIYIPLCLGSAVVAAILIFIYIMSFIRNPRKK